MLCEASWSNFKLIRRYINLLNLFIYLNLLFIMDTVSLSLAAVVALIFGLYRPSSGPLALRNVLKCSSLHTFFTIRFWHFSSVALIEKKCRTGTCASNNDSDKG